jgi:hypothetical protein
MNKALKLAREKMKKYEARDGSLEINYNRNSYEGSVNDQSQSKGKSQDHVEAQWRKEDVEIHQFQENIQKMKSRLEYHAMDRASKLLDIKNSNNLKKLLENLGCGNGGSDAGQAIDDLERTFEERKEFNENLKKYNDGKQDISPQRGEGPQNGPYYRKNMTSKVRPVEVPVFHEEYQDNPAWRTTLRERDYNTIDEQQHVRDLEDNYSKGKSNDFRKTGLEFDGSQNSEAKERQGTEFGTPKGA